MLFLAAAVVLVILVAGALGNGRGSSGAGQSALVGSGEAVRRPTTATHPRPTAPFRVGLGSLSLFEPSIPSLANAHLANGTPVRALPTVVRYPAQGYAGRGPADGLTPARAGGPYPLIVFSQGYDTPAEGYAGLLQTFTRAGYVVADPTYPDTDPSAPGGPNESDIVNHPRDLRFVISQLLAAARDPSSSLHGLIDPSRIAIAGQSDGGNVSLAVAANTCCADPRVRAAVILSGSQLASFGGTYYASGSPPLLVSQGDADPINVPGCGVGIYDQAPQPKYYLDLLGQSHLTPYQAHLAPYVSPGQVRDHVAATVIHFLDAYLRHKSGALAAMRSSGSVPGLMSLTSASLGARSTFCPNAP